MNKTETSHVLPSKGIPIFRMSFAMGFGSTCNRIHFVTVRFLLLVHSNDVFLSIYSITFFPWHFSYKFVRFFSPSKFQMSVYFCLIINLFWYVELKLCKLQRLLVMNFEEPYVPYGIHLAGNFVVREGYNVVCELALNCIWCWNVWNSQIAYVVQHNTKVILVYMPTVYELTM